MIQRNYLLLLAKLVFVTWDPNALSNVVKERDWKQWQVSTVCRIDVGVQFDDIPRESGTKY